MEGQQTAQAGDDQDAGSILGLHVRESRRRGDIFVVEGVARVNGDEVASCELTAAVVDWEGLGH